MQATVTGKREIKRGNKLELPCKVTVKAPFFTCSKVEPIIRDLCSNRTKIKYYFNNFAISRQLTNIENRALYRRHGAFIWIKAPAPIHGLRLYAR